MITRPRQPAAAALVLIWSAAALAGEAPSFTARPSVRKNGAGAAVSFSASAPTDCEVAILDAGGKVVRHLAAGALGGKAAA
ncbi:MAG: hypothetical protein ACYTGB_13835, partial [Planctomycetota bacterium]